MIKNINKNDLVVKHNNLIEAKYKLSLQEQKLILILASKIKKDDENFKKQTFMVKELKDILELKGESYYQEFQKITEKLISKVLKIKNKNRLLQISFLSSAEYFHNEGKVELCFDEKLKPYLLQLQENFTKYQIKNVIQLNSVYAIRIYELCKQYEILKERVFILDELRDILGINKDKYKRYNDFKRKVLLQAQEEINTKTDLLIDFKEIKTGRKVTSIKFIIAKQKVTLETKEKIEKVKEYINLCNCPETQKNELKDLFNSWINKYSDEVIKSNIYYTNNSDTENYIAYLTESIKKDFAKNSREFQKQLEVGYIIDIKELKKEARLCYSQSAGSCGVFRYGSKPTGACAYCPGIVK